MFASAVLFWSLFEARHLLDVGEKMNHLLRLVQLSTVALVSAAMGQTAKADYAAVGENRLDYHVPQNGLSKSKTHQSVQSGISPCLLTFGQNVVHVASAILLLHGHDVDLEERPKR